MRRLLTWVAGGVGLAALLRALKRRELTLPPPPDPAEELRAKLAEARDAGGDRDDFDAAEGIAVDTVAEPQSLEERRRAVHERAQQALGEMRADDD